MSIDGRGVGEEVTSRLLDQHDFTDRPSTVHRAAEIAAQRKSTALVDDGEGCLVMPPDFDVAAYLAGFRRIDRAVAAITGQRRVTHRPPARRRGSTRARRTVRRRRPVGSRAGPDDDPGEPTKPPRRGWGG